MFKLSYFMKAVLFTLLTCLIFPQIYGQSEVGIGVVSINFDENTKVGFYESSELKVKLKTVEFFNDASINSVSIRDLESHKDWLNPESMWLDHYQFIFRCKTIQTDCFEVYVSDSETLAKEIKLSTPFDLLLSSSKPRKKLTIVTLC